MLGLVSAHIAWKAKSNLELRWSYNAVLDDLVLTSATTISNICESDFVLTVDAIWKQLPLKNQRGLALNGWTSMNKLAITSVIAYCMDRNRALRETQLSLDEVDHLFFSCFES
jgi:hypothetical protein